VLGVIADITERGLAEETFRVVAEACPNSMVMFDGASGLRSLQDAPGVQ
jgi:hypothetical protein